MCWKIDKKEFKSNPEKYHKVAEEDIVVYKFGKEIDKKFFPSYKINFGYEPNYLSDKVEIKLNKDGVCYHGTRCFYSNEGYHSYSEECEIIKYLYNVGVYSKISNGNRLDYYEFETPFIGKFIIPNGTEYYENEDGEIVSSQIMWTGKGIYFSDIESKSLIKFKELCVG